MREYGLLEGAGLVGILVPDQEKVNGGVPPVMVPVQVTFWPISADVGAAVQETVEGLPDMIKLKLVILFKGEPVTVMLCVPTGAEGVTVNVMVELQLGLHGSLEMEYETPLGTPASESETGCEVPATKVLVIMF